MKYLSILFVSLTVCSLASAKIFEDCELAKKLYKDGTPKVQINDWMCLIKAESGKRTDIIGPQNSNKSYDYGIFQINDRYWCTVGKPGKDCNIDCNKLLDDDITDDIKCAKKIYNRHKFSAWYGWINKCKGKPLQDYSHCL
uniref:lysozyme n=1 Tax=Corethrella appendiculata TaxID=1370023 RepID=U5EWF7_9DIPT